MVQKEIQIKLGRLSSPLNVDLNQSIIEQNIEICKSYNFEEGSQLFGECILTLIDTKVTLPIIP